jgi:predicted acyltransferase
MTSAPAMEFTSASPNAVSTSSSSVTPSKRVVSVDALRGFDMFWIIGGDAIAGGLAQMFPDKPWAKVVREQFARHVEWGTTSWRDLITFQGIHFYDLIFPLFVFIVGVSLVFSLSRQIAEGGKGKAIRRIVIRSILLFCMGIVINGGLSQPWPEVRLMGVLQRIALAYLVAGLVFSFFSTRTLAIVSVVLLLGYWGILGLVKMPGEKKVSFDEGHNIANWIDYKILPGRKYDPKPNIAHDPEGILSTIPAVVTCLLGVFAGLLLRNGAQSPWKKGAILILCGVAAVALGTLWGMQFPVIKKLWTSSYVLFAGGCSAILLGVFYLIIDAANFRVWAKPFIWIGMNAILCYMLFDGRIIPLRASFKDGVMVEQPAPLCERLMGGSVRYHLNQIHAGLANFAAACLAMLIILLIVRFLFKRQIFLRV